MSGRKPILRPPTFNTGGYSTMVDRPWGFPQLASQPATQPAAQAAPHPAPQATTGFSPTRYRSREQLWPVLSDPEFVMSGLDRPGKTPPDIRPVAPRTGELERSPTMMTGACEPPLPPQAVPKAPARSPAPLYYFLPTPDPSEETSKNTARKKLLRKTKRPQTLLTNIIDNNPTNSHYDETATDERAGNVENNIATSIVEATDAVAMSYVCKCHNCDHVYQPKEFKKRHLKECAPAAKFVKVNCVCGEVYRIEKNRFIDSNLCSHPSNEETVQHDDGEDTVNVLMETLNKLKVSDAEDQSEASDSVPVNSNVIERNDDEVPTIENIELTTEYVDVQTDNSNQGVNEFVVTGEEENTMKMTIENIDPFSVNDTSINVDELKESVIIAGRKMLRNKNKTTQVIKDGLRDEESSGADECTYSVSREESEDEEQYHKLLEGTVGNNDVMPRQNGAFDDVNERQDNDNNAGSHDEGDENHGPRNNDSPQRMEQCHNNSEAANFEGTANGNHDVMTPQNDAFDDGNTDNVNERQDNDNNAGSHDEGGEGHGPQDNDSSQRMVQYHDNNSEAANFEGTANGNNDVIIHQNDAFDDGNTDNVNERQDNDNIARSHDEGGEVGPQDNDSSQINKQFHDNNSEAANFEGTANGNHDVMTPQNDAFDDGNTDNVNERQDNDNNAGSHDEGGEGHGPQDNDSSQRMEVAREMCAMFRFNFLTRRWMPRGIGEILILHNPERNTCLLLFRRQIAPGVFIDALRMFIHAGLKLQEMKNNNRAWEWTYHYLTREGIGVFQNIGLRFRSQESANEFHKRFYEMKELLLRNYTQAGLRRSLLATRCPSWPSVREVDTPSGASSTFGEVSPSFIASSPHSRAVSPTSAPAGLPYDANTNMPNNSGLHEEFNREIGGLHIVQEITEIKIILDELLVVVKRIDSKATGHASTSHEKESRWAVVKVCPVCDQSLDEPSKYCLMETREKIMKVISSYFQHSGENSEENKATLTKHSEDNEVAENQKTSNECNDANKEDKPREKKKEGNRSASNSTKESDDMIALCSGETSGNSNVPKLHNKIISNNNHDNDENSPELISPIKDEIIQNNIETVEEKQSTSENGDIGSEKINNRIAKEISMESHVEEAEIVTKPAVAVAEEKAPGVETEESKTILTFTNAKDAEKPLGYSSEAHEDINKDVFESKELKQDGNQKASNNSTEKNNVTIEPTNQDTLKQLDAFTCTDDRKKLANLVEEKPNDNNISNITDKKNHKTVLKTLSETLAVETIIKRSETEEKIGQHVTQISTDDNESGVKRAKKQNGTTKTIDQDAENLIENSNTTNDDDDNQIKAVLTEKEPNVVKDIENQEVSHSSTKKRKETCASAAVTSLHNHANHEMDSDFVDSTKYKINKDIISTIKEKEQGISEKDAIDSEKIKNIPKKLYSAENGETVTNTTTLNAMNSNEIDEKVTEKKYESEDNTIDRQEASNSTTNGNDDTKHSSNGETLNHPDVTHTEDIAEDKSILNSISNIEVKQQGSIENDGTKCNEKNGEITETTDEMAHDSAEAAAENTDENGTTVKKGENTSENKLHTRCVIVRSVRTCCRFILYMFGLAILTIVTIFLIYYFESFVFSFQCLE